MPIIQVVIGGLTGAFGVIAGGSFSLWFTWQKERQSVAVRFGGRGARLDRRYWLAASGGEPTVSSPVAVPLSIT
jgi:hypothetical protein